MRAGGENEMVEMDVEMDVDLGGGDEDSKATSPSRNASTDSNAPSAGPGSGTPVGAGAGKHPAPSPASGSGAAGAHSKRKRGPGIVTANACTECRKKRAKCDGQKPCGRCKSQRDVECIYEVPVRQSKENLRAEIDQLRRQQRSSESVLAALVQPGQWEEVLRRLRSGQSVEAISEWLGGTLPSGGGAVPPAFGRSQQLASFAGGHGGTPPYPGANPGARGVGVLGLDTSSPGPVSSGHAHPHPPSGLRQEVSQHDREHQHLDSHHRDHRDPHRGDANSPWGGGPFSAHSQPTSAQSESHADAMSWTGGDRNRGRVNTWIETIIEVPPQTQPTQQPTQQQHQQAQAHPRHQQTSSPQSTSPATRYRGLEKVLAPELPEMKIPAETWTDITSDSCLVQHLLALYFCWEYPTFASLSKEHFLKDFKDGRQRYCSPILVNALLALGCRFSSQPSTRANPDDPYSSGDHFFKESQRLFYLEDNHHTLTTIQALGIMSIREASCGRDSESWFFAGQSIRLAIEMGLHRIHDDRGDEDEIAVQAATFWGAFALDHAWSLATGSLPQSSCFPHLPPKPGVIDDVEASLWIPYTDDGEFAKYILQSNASSSIAVPVLSGGGGGGGGDDLMMCKLSSENTTTTSSGALAHRSVQPPPDGNFHHDVGLPLQRSCEQPSNVRSVYKCFCELSELVHQSLYILHSPGRPLTSRDLLNIYTQYLNWYDKIPEVLRLGHNFTPAVLFAHMYYHFAILLLFRPLIKLRIIGSSISPRDVCSQAADAIQGLLRSYSQLYTLRRTPSFVPYFVLTSSIMHLAIGATKAQESIDIKIEEQQQQPNPPPGGRRASASSSVKMEPRVAEAINQGIADLTEMAPCHHFAEQALSILRYLAKKWNIDVDISFRTSNAGRISATAAAAAAAKLGLTGSGGAKDLPGAKPGAAGAGAPVNVVNITVEVAPPHPPPPSSNKSPNDDANDADDADADNADDNDNDNNKSEESDGHNNVRPVTGSLNFFAPNVTDADFICTWGSTAVAAGGASVAATAASAAVEATAAVTKSNAIENPLFWPFPMQGRPMLPSGKLLRDAGFELL